MDKNTLFSVIYIDLEAFRAYLDIHRIQYEQHKRVLKIGLEREAYSDVGYYIGTETCIISFKTHKKSSLRLTGIPYLLSDKIIAKEGFTFKVNYPDIRSNRGYYPADADFWYEEINTFMDDVIDNLPEADFNPEKRIWTLGSVTYDINEKEREEKK